MSDWIDVNDKLPEERIRVIAYGITWGVEPDTFFGGWGRIGSRQFPDDDLSAKWRYSEEERPITWTVTHWQPLPAIPKPPVLKKSLESEDKPPEGEHVWASEIRELASKSLMETSSNSEKV